MSNLSYNYSGIKTAYECRQKFKYLYIDKLVPEGPESLALHFGTAVHAGIQGILESNSLMPFNVYWDSVAGMDFGRGRYDHRALGEMGVVLLERFERLHAKKFQIKQMETRLFGTLPGGIRCEGTPDFVGEFNGVPSIVDFKTASSRYDEGKLSASDQLLLYAYLAEQQIGYKPEQIVYIVFIKGKEPSIQTLCATIDTVLLARRIANIEAICKELDSISMFTQNFNSCFGTYGKCEFWSKCHEGVTE